MPTTPDLPADPIPATHRRALDQFELFCESLPDAIVIVDEAGRIVLANAQTEAMFGYSRQDVLGRDVEFLIPTELRQIHRRHRRDYAADPRIRLMGERQNLVGLRKGGATFSVEVSLSQLEVDGIVLVCSVIRDVSDRAFAEQLRASEERFRTLVDEATDGIFIADADGRYQDVNPAGCEMLGYSREEILGMSMVDVLAPDEATRIHRELARLRGGSPAKSEWRFRRKDGSILPVEVHGRQLTDSRFLGYVRDISQRRHVEDDLRASQKFIEAVARASPPVIYVFDLDERRLTYANRSILAGLGHPESVLAIDRLDALKAFMPAEEDVHLERVLREWRALGDGQVRDDEYRLYDAQGAVHWFLGREIAFARAADGSVRQILGTLDDITERKHTEQSLENSRALLQSFVEHTPAAVAMLDRELRYIAVSRRWMQNYELRGRNLIGQRHSDVFPDTQNMPDWQGVHARCLAGAVERRDEEPFVRANGRTEWLRWEVRPWRDEHGAIGGIIMFTEVITERKLAESRLRESEALLRGLVETSPIPMLVVASDAGNRVLLMNQRFTETFGYVSQDVPDIAAWWLRAYPDAAYREQIRAVWDEAIAAAERSGSHAIVPVAARVTCRDGGRRDIEVHMGRFGDRALVVFSDLTERKHTEELLRQSEERYRLIVENQTEFIVKWRPDGTRTFVNESYCRTFGVREQDCVGTNFFPLVAAEFQRAIVTQTAALTPAAPEFTDEHLSIVPGGRRWQQWTNRGIFGADGRLVEVLSTGRDITERKEAEEKLRQSQMHLIASQHIARVGSWEMDLVSLHDLSANPVRWSDECFRIFGYAPGEVVVSGATYLRRVHPDDRRKVQETAVLAVKNGTSYFTDHRLLLPDSTERIIHEQAEIVLDPVTGTPVRFIGTVQDISDRVRLEEQLRQSQKMQAIGQLAGGVAHDFNNLLTIINGHAEMLLDGKGSEAPERVDLAAIREAGERAALLTRQLLLFSRKAVLAPRVLDCNALVHRTSQMLRRLISEDVAVSTFLAPSLRRIRADASQIEQILLNLSLNACDAMPRGGRLTIETRNVSYDAQFCREHPEFTIGQYVQLVVADTGSGMTPQVKAHIFEPFFTTKGPGKGTGLGLATVYGIVQESGGFITVSSEVDAGTTFSVSLPALDGDDTLQSRDAVDRDRLRGHETILLVEDDAAVRQIAKLALAKYGYHVLEAGNGATALEVCGAHTGAIDALVSDIVMPEMNGRMLADAVRASRPRCRVLFMSGYNEDVLVRRGVHAGVEAFIQKPFTPEGLVAKLRQALDRQPDSESGATGV